MITASRRLRHAMPYSLADHIGVDGLDALTHAGRVPLRELGRRRAASKPGAPRVVFQKRDDGIGQAIQIVGGDDEPVYVMAQHVVDGRQIGCDDGLAAGEILHEGARQPLTRGCEQADIGKRDQLLRMLVEAGEDDVALDPEPFDTRVDGRPELAVPRDDQPDFGEAGRDSRKPLEKFQMSLARLEGGEHHHHGGPSFVGLEPEEIAPVFGLHRSAKTRQVEARRDDIVLLRCTDACPDTQIAYAGTDIDEGMRHPLDRPLRRQVHEGLESADVDEGHDVNTVNDDGHARASRRQTPEDAGLAGVGVHDIGSEAAEGPHELRQGPSCRSAARSDAPSWATRGS